MDGAPAQEHLESNRDILMADLSELPGSPVDFARNNYLVMHYNCMDKASAKYPNTSTWEYCCQVIWNGPHILKLLAQKLNVFLGCYIDFSWIGWLQNYHSTLFIYRQAAFRICQALPAPYRIPTHPRILLNWKVCKRLHAKLLLNTGIVNTDSCWIAVQYPPWQSVELN